MDSSTLARVTAGRLAVRPGLRDQIRTALTVTSTTRSGEPWTGVRLAEVRIPHPGPDGRARVLLTTELRARLSHALFDAAVAEKVNSASDQKGRAVYAVDLETQEVVAAASYHVPLQHTEPLSITALAPRTDGAALLGRACVPILKACIHQIADTLGRPSSLRLHTSGASAKEARSLYGFRRAPSLGRGRPSGAPEALVQDAPSLEEPPTPRTPRQAPRQPPRGSARRPSRR